VSSAARVGAKKPSESKPCSTGVRFEVEIQEPVEHPLRDALGIVVRLRYPRGAVDEDEPAHALRMRHRQQNRLERRVPGCDTAARREPTASITARASCIHCSSVGGLDAATESDSPTPRWSKRISRRNDASRPMEAREQRLVVHAVDGERGAGVDEKVG